MGWRGVAKAPPRAAGDAARRFKKDLPVAWQLAPRLVDLHGAVGGHVAAERSAVPSRGRKDGKDTKMKFIFSDCTSDCTVREIEIAEAQHTARPFGQRLGAARAVGRS